MSCNLSFKYEFLESDKTVRRTDGTMIYQSGQSLANSFSSMVVQENHSGGNNSFANFINSQDRLVFSKWFVTSYILFEVQFYL